MSESAYAKTHSLTLVRVAGDGPALYSLEGASQIAGIHSEMLRYYCRIGLLGPERMRQDVELTFDDDALYELCRYEHYRRHHGVNRQSLRLICRLWREVERLQKEVRFLRKP